MAGGARRRTGPVTAAFMAGLLAGCTVVGPDYEPPDPKLPDSYAAPVPALFEGGPAPGQWWTVFEDAVLEEMVARGIDANPDIRIALSRIREARAAARAVEGETGPQFDMSAGPTAEWRSRSTGSSSGNGGRRGSGEGTEYSAEAGLSGLWEIDLFGGLQRSREAAWAEAQRQEALGREALRVTVAEIARTYVERRTAQRRLELAEQSLDLQRRTLQLVEQRVESGLAPGLDRMRARGEVASLTADLGPLRAQIDQLGNALAVLLGRNPGPLDGLLSVGGPIPSAGRGGAVGVPRNLLRRRPDVQAAELAIVAATADVGVETADLYPRLTLPGSITLQVDEIGSDAATAVVAAISALLDLPLYDGGQRRAEVTAAEERAIQATLDYRQTLLAALEEVERALLEYAGARDRVLALEDAVVSNRAAFEQSRILYRQGFASFIDVLDAQRTLTDSQQELALARRDRALRVVDLYSALGTTLEPPAE